MAVAFVDDILDLPGEVINNNCDAVEFSMFTTIDGKPFIGPKCFVKSCGRSLVQLPPLKISLGNIRIPASTSDYLVCPSSLQYDDAGEPTGRLVSWAHNRTLVDVKAMRIVQSYKSSERKMYLKPLCFHSDNLQVMDRVLTLYPGINDLDKVNDPNSVFDNAEDHKLFVKCVNLLSNIINSDEFKNADVAKVKKAMALDRELCKEVDLLTHKVYTKNKQKEDQEMFTYTGKKNILQKTDNCCFNNLICPSFEYVRRAGK